MRRSTKRESRAFEGMSKRRLPFPDSQRFASRGDRLDVLNRDWWRCRYCQHRVSWRWANIDHAIPWKHGGPTDFRNFVTACGPCNKRKANREDMKPCGLQEHRQRIIAIPGWKAGRNMLRAAHRMDEEFAAIVS